MATECGPIFLVAEDYETFVLAEHQTGGAEDIFIILEQYAGGGWEFVRGNSTISPTIELASPLTEPNG